MQIFEVYGDIVIRDRNATSVLNNMSNAVDNAQSRFSNFANMAANVGNSLMNFGNTMINSVTKPIVSGVMGSITAFSDLNEATNVVDVTFGKNSKSVKSWSKTLLDSFGIGQLQGIEFSGTMGSIFKSLGMGEKDVLNMSKKVVELSGDFASFKNLSPEESFEKIRSGLLGETEPLKAVGILVDENTVKTYAMKNGLKKNWKELSQSEKVMWRYKSILSQTKDAHGDFARTGDSFANKMKKIKGSISNLGIEIGGQLMPYAQKLLDWAAKGVKWFSNLSPAIKKIIVVIGLLAAGIGPVLVVGGGLITMIGGVAAIFSMVSGPILAVVAAIGVLIGPVVAIGAGFVTLVAKTGIVQTAFQKLKALCMGVVAFFKGDFKSGIDILVNKFGMSKKGALDLGVKIQLLKSYMLKLKDMIVNVSTVLGAIFTNNKKKMIDTLIEKFGYSKKEAELFWKKVQLLKSEIGKFASKVKDVAVKALKKLIETTKDIIKWVIKHRKEIMKVIETFVDFGIGTVKAIKEVINFVKKLVTAWNNFKTKFRSIITGSINIAYNLGVKIGSVTKNIINYFSKMYSSIKSKFNLIKSVASIAWSSIKNKIINAITSIISKAASLKNKFSSVFNSIKSFAQGVIDKFNAVKNAISGVINKISGIKFPSAPKWFKGFARGVTNFRGGLALVGEQGPEIVRLPPGSDVIPNNKIKDNMKDIDYKSFSTPNNVKTTSNIIYMNMNNVLNRAIDINDVMTQAMNNLKRKGVIIRNG